MLTPDHWMGMEVLFLVRGYRYGEWSERPISMVIIFWVGG